MQLRNFNFTTEQRAAVTEALRTATTASQVVAALGIINRHGIVPHSFGSRGVHVEIGTAQQPSHQSAFQLSAPNNPDLNARWNSSAAHQLWGQFSSELGVTNPQLNNNLRSLFRAVANCANSDQDKIITETEWHNFRNNLGNSDAVRSLYSDEEAVAAIALGRYLEATETELDSAASLVPQIARLRQGLTFYTTGFQTLETTVRNLASPFASPASLDGCTNPSNPFESAQCAQVTHQVNAHHERRTQALTFESPSSPNVPLGVQIGGFLAFVGLAFLVGRGRSTAPNSTSFAAVADGTEALAAQRSLPPTVLNAAVELLGWDRQGVPSLAQGATRGRLAQTLASALRVVAERSSALTGFAVEQRRIVATDMVQRILLPLQARLANVTQELRTAENTIATQQRSLAQIQSNATRTNGAQGRALDDSNRITAGLVDTMIADRNNLQIRVAELQGRLESISGLIRAVRELIPRQGQGQANVQLETLPAVAEALASLESSVRAASNEGAALSNSAPTVIVVNTRTIRLPMSLPPRSDAVTRPIAPVRTEAAAGTPLVLREATRPPVMPEGFVGRAPTREVRVPNIYPPGTERLPPAPPARPTAPEPIYRPPTLPPRAPDSIYRDPTPVFGTTPGTAELPRIRYNTAAETPPGTRPALRPGERPAPRPQEAAPARPTPAPAAPATPVENDGFIYFGEPINPADIDSF